MSHSRGDQPDGDAGHQVDEHRQAQRDQHDCRVFAPDAVKPGEKIPVDDVPADLDQEARENGPGNRLHVMAKTQ